MDVIDLLTADHNRMRGLFAQFTVARDANDTQQMRWVAHRLTEELTAHEELEEKVFYEQVRGDNDEVGAEVAEGYEEHHVADLLMNEIAEVASSGNETDEQWIAKVKVLIESVQHHIEEEERELFVSVRSERPEHDLEEMAGQVEEMKDELGAPSPADADGLSRAELLKLAREQRIPGRSTMDADHLAATVDARDSVRAH